MKIGNEFRIGLWTIISIVVLVFGVKYLKGQLHTTTTYYMLSSNVDGLAESSHVELDGYRVGIVRAIDYDYNRRLVVVELNIDPDLKIPADTRALIDGDLLNASTIRLQLGTDSRILHWGDTLQGGGMKPGMIEQAGPMLTDVSRLMPKIDSLLSGMNRIVNDSKVHETLLEVNGLTRQLQHTLDQLNRQLPQILTQANHATANLDTLSSQLKEAEIARVVANANSAIAHADSLIVSLSHAQGTASQLLHSTELHDQLTATIANVDSLVNDIKAHPEKYINVRVFGR